MQGAMPNVFRIIALMAILSCTDSASAQRVRRPIEPDWIYQARGRRPRR